jgi:TPP-dependent pyruvate/acetoin dehydrogenase alpha subunit
MLRLHQRAREITEGIRSGAGPGFLEVMTYRWREHVGPGEDYSLGFRTKDEAAPWIANDQVRRIGNLLDAGIASRIRREVEAEIAAAFAFAEDSPWPQPQELYTDVVDRRLAL